MRTFIKTRQIPLSRRLLIIDFQNEIVEMYVGTGPLPDWLRNLVRGCAGPMVALDNFADNLCLQGCIAVDQGALPHQNTHAVRELAKNYLKFRTVPPNVGKTSLDELDKIERHFNQGKELTDWLGIRVYEPEHEENGEFMWYQKESS